MFHITSVFPSDFVFLVWFTWQLLPRLFFVFVTSYFSSTFLNINSSASTEGCNQNINLYILHQFVLLPLAVSRGQTELQSPFVNYMSLHHIRPHCFPCSTSIPDQSAASLYYQEHAWNWEEKKPVGWKVVLYQGFKFCHELPLAIWWGRNSFSNSA